ncbi:MAG TPA: hypothetical protein VFE98_00870 [Candidatus Bathyarchaeia archaeon]|nr:hypothetical protein [Candidatus Bathyarchaeia archaeon]
MDKVKFSPLINLSCRIKILNLMERYILLFLFLFVTVSNNALIVIRSDTGVESTAIQPMLSSSQVAEIFGSSADGRVQLQGTTNVGQLPAGGPTNLTAVPHIRTLPRSTRALSGTQCWPGVWSCPLVANYTSTPLLTYPGFDELNQLQCMCTPPTYRSVPDQAT